MKTFTMMAKTVLHAWTHWTHIIARGYGQDRSLVCVACCGSFADGKCDFHLGTARFNPITGREYMPGGAQ